MEKNKTCWNCEYHAELYHLDKSDEESKEMNRHVCTSCLDFNMKIVHEIPLERMGENCEMWIEEGS